MPVCPLCNKKDLVSFYETKLPALSNKLYDDRSKAVSVKRFKVSLMQCEECLFALNINYNENNCNYDKNYNNNQLYSNVYSNKLIALAKKLHDDYLNNYSRVLEIGCGNGALLSIFKKQFKVGIKGYDPSYKDGYNISDFVVKEYFAEDAAKYNLIIMRYVLDQVSSPDKILTTLKNNMTVDSILYLELPDFDYIKNHKNFSQISYEAKYYYSHKAIKKLLENLGFVVTEYYKTDAANFSILAKLYEKELKSIDFYAELPKDKKIVLWSAAGRSVSYLLANNISEDIIKFVVDIDKDKQNKFIPITGQKVVGVEEAQDYKPDIIVVPNKLYLSEIRALMPGCMYYLLN